MPQKGLSGPHQEDAAYTPQRLSFEGPSSSNEFKEALESGLQDSVEEGFEIELDDGQKHIPVGHCRKLRTPELSIEHILADGSIETNTTAERRLMSMLGIGPDMLHDEKECIEQAYDGQGRNFAYVIPSKSLRPRTNQSS